MPTEAARPQRRFPWVLAAAAAAALGARLLGPAVQDRVDWVPAEQAAALASDERPLFYNFTAEWCAPCRVLERDVFANPARARTLSRSYVPVRVLDRQREDGANPPAVEALEERFAVGAFPTLVVARPDGTVLARLEGYQGGQSFTEFMNTASVAARKKR
jgi:thiol:disulfide interchange protein